ncbi:hypothetical protein B14_200035 (plasmid) [Bacillus licheniformis]|uniref:hypothetical protein n=1 Tax=Bacillus subtilis group TaxID=653685 RepID=UPI0009B78993|nr:MULTISPECIES: hypothetical protein [Bacillus subtilis group]ARC67246.1 hypothetical protein B14_200035 [Bacillus licheniformis]ARW46113.1 hypothetical protein S100141_04893 [Bacillus licheniformis]MCY1628380.1 hypothetical protein [Bacillus paralicheniformis]MDE1421903.1 hypothetical protein [Bacillus licheniformis]MEC0475908.1 hypothetical protein [Bacillus licheniformis]
MVKPYSALEDALQDYKNRLQRRKVMLEKLYTKRKEIELTVKEEYKVLMLEAEKRLIEEFLHDLEEIKKEKEE